MKLLSPALVGALLSSFMPAAPDSSLVSRVQAIASAFGGEMGVYAKNLATKETLELDADTRYPTASVIKLAVMVEAFHRIAEGTLLPDARVRLREADKVGVGDSGTLNELHDGIELTIADLLNLMIVVSDNTATNLLVNRLGTASINARMDAYGLKNTRIFRPTFRDGHPDCCPALEREFGLGMSTPRETAALMELIATGKAVSAEASKQMTAILRRQQDLAMIPRRLPQGEKITIANKTGTDAEKQPDASGERGHIHNDAAIVMTPRATYVLAIYTRRGRSRTWTADNEALIAGAEVSKAIYEAWGN
jgi:beta-lactamase class A